MALAQVQLPHNLDAILKEGGSQIDTSSNNLIEQLQAGILLNENKLKFWVDSVLHANAFYIFARGLKILHGDNPCCWNWKYMPDPDTGVNVEVAELIEHRELDVSKNFPVKYLTPWFLYQVSFVLMMKDKAYGFKDHPVTFKLVIQTPCGPLTIQHQEDLSKLPPNTWKEVPVSPFGRTCNMSGDIEISMFEHGCQPKSGLIVNKIKIRPLNKHK